MVASTDNPVISDHGNAPMVIPKAEGLPVGNYRIIGWDLDWSGRLPVDEILQIAAFTPDKQFSLYVMPCRDLNVPTQRRHQLKVVTIHRYRVLKHVKNNKPIKTKSEISGLSDFISWLEEVKGDAKDGIILVFHEALNSCPALLLHSLGRYPHADLLDRFKAVVAGFANVAAIARSKSAKPVSNLSLKSLASTLLGTEESLESASDRARLTYQVLQKVCLGDGNEGAGDSNVPNMSNLISCVRNFAQSSQREEELLVQQQEMIKRQDSLKPVFFPVRGNRKDKEKAYILRQNLIDANVDMTLLTEAWTSGQKDAVNKLLDEKACILDEKDRDDLLTKIEWHFVPKLRPKIDRRPSHSKKSKKSINSTDKNGTVESGFEEITTPNVSPDTTTVSLDDTQKNVDTESSEAVC